MSLFHKTVSEIYHEICDIEEGKSKKDIRRLALKAYPSLAIIEGECKEEFQKAAADYQGFMKAVNHALDLCDKKDIAGAKKSLKKAMGYVLQMERHTKKLLGAEHNLLE